MPEKIVRKKERGQALVLMVMGMVTLLGFAALAVDGSLIYSDRRHAQNAADAASLAGAGMAADALDAAGIETDNWNCPAAIHAAANTAIAYATDRAADADFSIDGLAVGYGNKVIVEDTADGHQIEIECVDQSNGYWRERYLDVRTTISIDTDTAFAHFVYGGRLRNTVTAKTRIKPGGNVAFNNAIVSLNEKQDCSGNQNGVVVNGSITVTVEGSGIYSNGCLVADGIGLNVGVTNGGIAYSGEYANTHPGSTNLSPPPSDTNGLMIPNEVIEIPAPVCDPTNQGVYKTTGYTVGGVIPAGTYSSISLSKDRELEAGGLYCITDGDFYIGNQVNLSIDESNGKKGVTIYLMKGSFATAGGGEVNLTAPPASQPLIDPGPYPPIPGVLIYLAYNNTSLVKLRGNSNSTYIGVVFAPDGTIDAAGDVNEVGYFNTQMIGKNVFIGGNASVTIQYDGEDLYHQDAGLKLFE